MPYTTELHSKLNMLQRSIIIQKRPKKQSFFHSAYKFMLTAFSLSIEHLSGRVGLFNVVTHGLMSKWTYILESHPLLKPVDNALTGRPPPSNFNLQCTLFALPARFGGLGIDMPSRAAAHES